VPCLGHDHHTGSAIPPAGGADPGGEAVADLDYLLFNQCGVILERAIRRGMTNVVLCRLHYRLEYFTPRPDRPAESAEPASQHRRADRSGPADGRDQSQVRVLEGGGEDLVGNPEQPPER
jgi:hypothetical protein